jgi:Alw26I/Eco31I/Esp3I family type II restriction m6 adenine DNA methyltransferase
MTFAPLYDQKVIQKEFLKIEITTLQRKRANDWIKKIKNNELKKEVENYSDFRDTILMDILGYPRKEIKFEEKDVEFSIKDVKGRTHVVFEAKGTKTKDLFARQNYGKREQEHPVLQTVSNMQRFAPPAAYGVCTNYNDFILLDRELGITKCHRFTFTDIENNIHKLKEFIGIFSYKNLVKEKSLEILYDKSITAEKEFTKEFYKLYHETRLMLIREFQDNPKERISRSEAIHITQIFLNRLIFIFFVEDKGYVTDNQLFAQRIFGVLKSDDLIDISKRVYDVITELFVAFDVGSDKLGVFGFNGGLFSGVMPQKISFSDLKEHKYFEDLKQNSSLLKTTKLNEKAQKIINKFGDQLNPIISNLLIMESFDFNTEVNVNILGHIFEQSISDIEELNKVESSKRKKDGVYYTSSHLTDYICKNTIIPFFSKKGTNSIAELMDEYQDNVDELENKFKDVKILDPACGSGAFLTKAIDILLEIGQGIQNLKENSGKYSTDGQFTLTKWNEDEAIREIIEKSIYGIDVNRESVGITQLSLFLKLASSNRKLIGLSKNIQIGNSLIDDSSVDDVSFLWEERFPNVFMHPNLKKHINKDHVDGFDIILGNPPWEILKPDVDEFFTSLQDTQKLIEIKYPDKQIKFSNLKPGPKKRIMEECLKQKNIQEEFEKYLKHYKIQMEYFGSSNKYHLQGRGDMNLYKLFVEKALDVIRQGGFFGMVMPSGIYYDLGTKELRQELFENNSILELCGFVNKKPIFEDVHRQFKFCTLIFKKGGYTNRFLTKFFVMDDSKLQNFRETAFEYDLAFLKKSSPQHLTIIESTNKIEQKIFDKLFKFPILEDPSWGFKPSRELDMTNDAGLFHSINVGPPLYEGKMIHMFSHTLAPPRLWLDKEQVEEKLKQKELGRIPAKIKRIQSDLLPRLHAEDYRLVWRSAANSTDTRTLISTILPPNVFLGNSLNFLVPIIFDKSTYVKPITNTESIFLCGILNSFVQDFIIRHKVSRNINYFHINGQPVPRFDEKNTLHKKIIKNSTMLICTSDEFLKLREEVGILDYITDPLKRQALEIQINACVAKIYDLTKEELEYILESFSSVDKKFKDNVLDEFLLIK